MATISLRRTKDKALIGLPPKTIETCYVELLGEERELYDEMEMEAKNILKNYINNGILMRYYSTVLGIILRLRQICTDMALCPSDLKSLLPSNKIEGTKICPLLFTFSNSIWFFNIYLFIFFVSQAIELGLRIKWRFTWWLL